MNVKRNTPKSSPTTLSAHIIRFTPAEEAAISRAIKESVRFMKTYGRGRKPRMIDKTKYENYIQ